MAAMGEKKNPGRWPGFIRWKRVELFAAHNPENVQDMNE